MEFRLLGQLEVSVGASSLDLGQFRQRSLLALLLVHRGQVLSTDQIMDSLWGEAAAASKQNALWVHISNLRTALEPDRPNRSEGSFLRTRAPGYVLEMGDAVVDVDRFESLSAEGRLLMDSDPAAASITLGEGLSIWRGRALEDFMYEPFAEDEIRRLDELRLGVVEDRIAADLSRGLAAELVGELEGLVRANPLRERLAGQFITALHRSGRAADSERAYLELSTHLREELGIEPSQTLVELRERLTAERQPGVRTRSAEQAGVETLAVRGYELRTVLSMTGHEVVHRAYQPAVGREVILKRITADRADSPDFIRRFEREATIVASIEHPHVLPLYDFWREPGAAFLVTRLTRGGTLAERISDGIIAGESADRFVNQIGGALRATHRLQIPHGAITAANVFLDTDGNYFLGEFDIAADQSSPSEGIEEDRRAFADLVRDATARSLVDGSLTAMEDERNPYKGLRAFEQADAADFFGRERVVERLLSRLGSPGRGSRFVVLVGPSGSGKSSVVRAGLIPTLRKGALAGSEGWFVSEMHPGRNPFEHLADALEAVAEESAWSIFDRLVSTPSGIADTVDSVVPGDAGRLLLHIDQFEELYVQTGDGVSVDFINGLVHAIHASAGRLVVVATMRADFYDRPLRHRALGELFRRGTEVITPMSTDELALAVAEPAMRSGVRLEPSLVARVVADVSDQPAALPLLQYALTELFENRGSVGISLDTYNRLGGVRGALVKRADQLYEGLGDPGQYVAQQVLLRLVSVGNADSEDTRRRVLVADLMALAPRVHVQSVLDVLGKHRLLTFDRDPISRSPTVEIAHEALIREWGVLRELVEENRVGMRVLDNLSMAALEWQATGHDASQLYRGTRLATTIDWVGDLGTRVRPLEKQFLAACEQNRDDELEFERQRVVLRDRQNRRLRRLLVGVATVAVVALLLGVFAVQQRNRADQARSVGETRRLAADAPSLVETNRRVALLLAAEAYARDPNALTLGSLQRVLIGTSGLLGHLGSGTVYHDAIWSSDGRRVIGLRPGSVDIFDATSFTLIAEIPGNSIGLARAGPGGLLAVVSAFRTVAVLDVESQERLQTFTHDEQIQSLEFTPDGTGLAVGDARGDVRLFNVASGAEVWRIRAHPERNFQDVGAADDLTEPQPHEPGSFSLGVRDIAFLADGTSFATSGGPFLRTWSAADGSGFREVLVQRPSTTEDTRTLGRPAEIMFRAGGREVVARVNRFIQVWDMETGGVVENQVVLSDSAAAIADARTVAAAFADQFAVLVEVNQVAVTDILTGERLQAPFDLQVSSSEANIAIAPDERTLVSAGVDGIVVWALDGRELIGTAVPQRLDEGGGLHLSPDGQQLAVNTNAGVGSGASLWDLSAGPARRVELPTGTGRVVLELPGFVVLQDGHAELQIHELEDLTAALGGFGALNNYSQALSTQASLIVFGTGDPDPPQLHVFDLATNELITVLDQLVDMEATAVVSVSFNSDGSRLAAATLNGIGVVFDTRTWEVIGAPIGSGAGQVTAVEYSPDGRFLATANRAGRILLRDADSHQPSGAPLLGSTAGLRFAGSQPLAFAADGRFLVSSIDGVGRLWDLDSRTQIGTGFVSATGTNITPSETGAWLAVAKETDVVIYELDMDSWFDVACAAAGRNLTLAEWEQFGPEDVAPRQTCPQWDAPATDQ